jgi:hypothetical protein
VESFRGGLVTVFTVLGYELFDGEDCGLGATVVEGDNGLDEKYVVNDDDCGDRGVSDVTDCDVDMDGNAADEGFAEGCDTVKGNRDEGFGDDEYEANCDDKEGKDDCVDDECENDDRIDESEEDNEADDDDNEGGNEDDVCDAVGDESKEGSLL